MFDLIKLLGLAVVLVLFLHSLSSIVEGMRNDRS